MPDDDLAELEALCLYGNATPQQRHAYAVERLRRAEIAVGQAIEERDRWLRRVVGGAEFARVVPGQAPSPSSGEMLFINSDTGALCRRLQSGEVLEIPEAHATAVKQALGVSS